MKITLSVILLLSLVPSCSNSSEGPSSAPEVLKFGDQDGADLELLFHPQLPGKGKNNQVWCATIGMAWQALLHTTVKGPITVSSPNQQEIVDLLNSKFTDGLVAPASSVVFGGPPTQENFDRVSRELNSKFGNRAPKPSFAVRQSSMYQVGYAYLSKDLPFETPFEDMGNDLRFAAGQKKVACFGLEPDSKDPKDKKRRAQLRAHWNDSAPTYPKTFALEFKIEDGNEQLFVIRMPQSKSLLDTWLEGTSFMQDNPARPVGNAAKVMIPKFNLDLSTTFPGMKGAKITNPGWEQFEVSALHQRIQLSLLETGAHVDSESHVEFLGASVMSHNFIVNDGFLVAIKEKDAPRPYLLAWFGNDLLLASTSD